MQLTNWIWCILFLAATPWVGMVLFAGLRRVTLAQTGLMAAVLAFGLSAYRLDFGHFASMGLVVVLGSNPIAPACAGG